jgi:transcriptional regulator with XRE-family HTH domain
VPRTATSEIHAKLAGQQIRRARAALELTQTELAARLAVSPSYLAGVEAGRRNLTLGQLANIAGAMRLGLAISFVHPDGSPVVDARGASPGRNGDTDRSAQQGPPS